jgi:hypothetical protein
MSGHGHVIPNPDGSKARCGGPGICAVCSKEAAALGWKPPKRPMSVQEQTDRYLGEVRDHAGLLLERDHANGSAGVILGLVANLERTIRTEREELFNRVTALRLALRQIADEADASEPISVKVARFATEAVDADDVAASGAGTPPGASR